MVFNVLVFKVYKLFYKGGYKDIQRFIFAIKFHNGRFIYNKIEDIKKRLRMNIEIPHRFYMAFMAIAIFIFGILIGSYLVENMTLVSVEAVLIGLAFTSIITMLIIGSLVVEVKDILESKKSKK